MLHSISMILRKLFHVINTHTYTSHTHNITQTLENLKHSIQ
jgi:hypothetical protein